MEEKYCYICGKKMFKVWTGKYCEKTGKKKYDIECDVIDCAHGYHKYGFLYKFFYGFFPFHKCKLCGHENVPEY